MVSEKRTLDIISNGLQSRYRNTVPLPIDMNWYPGQICIALYYLDNMWYRGRVKQVLGENLVVEYVDFGNTETVEKSKLRKNVALCEIPIQCHKLPIRSDCVPVSREICKSKCIYRNRNNTYFWFINAQTTPEKTWPRAVMDFAHYTILEKLCRVIVRKEATEDFYRVCIRIIDRECDWMLKL